MDSTKQPLSLKQKRAQARATLKSARYNSASSALDSYDATVEDVYDGVDEEEYRRIVERERAKEDFVVDDGESFFILVNIWVT